MPSAIQKAAGAVANVAGGSKPDSKPDAKSNASSSSLPAVPNGTTEQAKVLPSQQDWAPPVYYQTLILGAGLSGIAMACLLKRKGFGDDFIILERESGIAGTWYSNSYPGCGVDVPAPLYSYSFAQKGDWSRFVPKRDEIKAYISTVAAEYDLMDKFHLQTLVKEARFDESTNLWHIYSEDLPQRSELGVEPKKHHYVCKFFVSAVGGLSEPNECNIPGKEKFKGAIFHSARWDHSVDYTNKNVVVIGNGSSATQLVPEVAKKAKSVTQFVRAQHWIASVPHDPFAMLPGWKWLCRHFYVFRKISRALVFLVMESHFIMTMMNPLGALYRWWFARFWCKPLAKKAPKEYFDHIYPKGKILVSSKRRIFDDEYVPCLNQPHVNLEFEKSASIEEDAVITDKGKRIPADVIVLCNGFTTARAGFPMDVYGRGGEEVHSHWEKYGGGGPLHYRSCMLANYPNLVQLVGTNSATGHTSLIFTTECQIEFALEVAKPLLNGKKPSTAAISHNPSVSPSSSLATLDKVPAVEPRLSAEVQEQNYIHWRHKQRVWSYGHSWYIDTTSKRVTALYPDSQITFWLRATFPTYGDLIWSDLPAGEGDFRTWWKRWGSALGIGRMPKKTAQQAGIPAIKLPPNST